MATVTTRRRPDGLVEIVPPTALQRFMFDFRSAFVAMGVLAALVVLAALYAAVGSPVLLVSACAVVAFALWRRGIRRQRETEARAARPQRRSSAL
jgi:hypothetical protein